MDKVFGNIINGKEETDGEKISLNSPVDGSLIGYIVNAGREAVERAIKSSREAFMAFYASSTISSRQKLIGKLADIVQEKADIYAQLESQNTGKTIRQSTFMDIPLAISHIRYFAETDEFKFQRNITHPEYPGTEGIVQNAPMGVIASIAPWNVPFLMAVWKIIPPVLAGNSVVIKPSHYTPLTAMELVKDMKVAGFPDGLVNLVNGTGRTTGTYLIESDSIDMISFTGSTPTGSKVMEQAAKNIKKVSLELGGKSPNIVFADADLDHAVKGVIFGIFLNAGQLCESASRLIIEESVMDKFLEKMKIYLDSMKSGNPLDFDTDISAITTLEQKEKIDSLIRETVNAGGKIFYSRKMKDAPDNGIYFPPTLLSGLHPASGVSDEEIFGPVLTVYPFRSEEEAIELANSTKYGLAAGIWTGHLNRAGRIASMIEAGTVWINEYHLLSAAAPRGGFKKSGIGRELGLEGIMEYTQTRHIFYGNNESGMSDIAYGILIKPT
ncbi:aldehyde dehydrogenase family protein [Ferroplasma sp.]|uniref:aldehyde dehydrogenase family protein n=1 Tax=Ferroplasma sp. TaxID=2591003 RepID=UPI002615776A|nr:aldehyde dehydrogenase family protein [Ferroplasma sp.]